MNRRASVLLLALLGCGEREPDFAAETRARRATDEANARAEEDCRAGDLSRCVERAGDARACVALGLATEARDPALALSLYLAACEGGVLEGCANAAEPLGATDPTRARALGARACEGGVATGCQNLGVLHQEAGALAEAEVAYARGCELGAAMSCSHAGNMRGLGLTTLSMEDAYAFYQRGCDGDDAVGCTNLGLSVVATDPARARVLFSRACALSHAAGCHDLGVLLGRADEREASLEALTRGCELGSPQACALLERLGVSP